MKKNWLDGVARVMERYVPDAVTTSIILMVILFGISLSLGLSDGASLGQALGDTVGAYYQGLWRLLTFTMQMTLILVLSLVIAATPVFKKFVVTMSRLPRTAFQVVLVSSLCVAVLAYLNWGLALALGPLIAIHFAKEAEARNLPVCFLFLQAILAGAGSVWQFGVSASAPLLVATPGHFLEEETGIMSFRTTIWTPAAIVHVLVFLAATIIVGYFFMPKKFRRLSEFPASEELAESVGDEMITEAVHREEEALESAEHAPPPQTLAKKMEASSFVLLPLWLILGAWLIHHFVIEGRDLDINSLNTIFLLTCFVLHRNVARFTKALQGAIGASWPIVVLYHLYAGVAGLIQFTPVGDFLATLVDPISTPYTYPLLTAIIATVVACFIPTSGGQWAIQGFVTVRAAEAVGVTAQRGLLALSVGDHMGNLISPFWAVVGANIARIDFRLIFGYRLIFAALWFTIGVLAFTFLPC